MSEIQRFEDLVAWQLARALTRDIYGMTRQQMFSRDFGLVDQIRRAAVSVMSNIAEGFERQSDAEHVHFYTIAKASCAEIRSQLYVALDAAYIDQTTFDTLNANAERVGRVIGGLRTSVGRKNHSGNGHR
ncbi:MAG: four helix bundle protein [Chloroflexi bacterium]|nr:four helix bundle protein [Chloroflexota bacterium]